MSNICPSQTRGDDRPNVLTGLFARRADEPERPARAATSTKSSLQSGGSEDLPDAYEAAA
jgi:hypothetical protein